MKERPILFSGAMVRALLDGSKTQTRRVVKPQPTEIPADARTRFDKRGYWWPSNACQSMVSVDTEMACLCPYGYKGDRLWVRETWAVGKCADGFKPRELAPRVWLGDNGGLWYPADNTEPRHAISPRGRTRVGRFMPRWASRITLEITDVRVQRLQEISEDDARAEGFDIVEHFMYHTALAWYADLWDSLNAKRAPWESNPWVWAISFKAVSNA